MIGRIRRMRDLGAARAAFEQALGIAEAEDLPVWRLRALHELGTIDLFDGGATDRLSQARRTAAELGRSAPPPFSTCSWPPPTTSGSSWKSQPGTPGSPCRPPSDST